MADESSATETANVETVAPKTADGATPPPEKSAIEGQKLSAADAREILRNASNAPAKAERDPLFTEQERDPLFPEAESDPLTSGIELTEEIPGEAVAEETEQAEEDAAEVAPEVEVLETDPAAEDEAKAVEAETKRKRLNFNRKNEDGEFIHDDRERAILSLSAEEGISFRAAERRLFGDAKAPEETPRAEVKPEPTVEEISAQIEALKKERRSAADNFDNVRHVELTEQIEELAEQKIAARERQAVKETAKQQAKSQFAKDQETSLALAAELYSDSIKAGTKLNAELTKEIARLERVSPEVFKDPEWPLAQVAKVAAKLGIAPKAALAAAKPPAAKPKEVAVQPVAKRPSRSVPSPSAGGVSGTVPTNRVAEISQQIAAAKARHDLPALQKLTREAVALQAQATH